MPSSRGCPLFGGKVKPFDASQAKAMKGVLEVFEIEPTPEVHSCGGVAVVAETTYIARRGHFAR
jgi:isoquinoline 1-oxidoreductase beta subunit